MSYLGQAGIFLIQTLFGLFILAVLLRLLLQIVRGDFYSPIAQILVRLTNPAVLPLRRAIPGFFGVDFASVVLVVGLQVLELYLVAWIQSVNPALPGILLLAFAELLKLTIYVFLFAILIRVILSWVSPYGDNPALDVLINLTEPVLRPARRLIPAVAGLDLSPIAVLIFMQLALMLIVWPLTDLGRQLL